MSQTHDHEVVSIYPFDDEQTDLLMNNSNECVLMWATKDGWPVGVTHAFVWHEGKIWITFTAQRHRAAAIRRDNRVSVNVSSGGYPAGADASLPTGAITFKGHGEFFEDDETKKWFYTALSRKLNPGNQAGEDAFYSLLDSPLRIILAVEPVKRIMYNAGLAARHFTTGVDESELGEKLSGDVDRMNKERAARGLDPV
jgi:hypothetical protein